MFCTQNKYRYLHGVENLFGLTNGWEEKDEGRKLRGRK
jgi:hypothetical protein